MARVRLKNAASLIMTIALLPLLYHYANLVVDDMKVQWDKKAISYSGANKPLDSMSKRGASAGAKFAVDFKLNNKVNREVKVVDFSQDDDVDKVEVEDASDRFSLGKLGLEPSPTAQMVAQIASRNVEESSPGLPGAQNYMPHLRNKPLAMKPVVNISQGRMEAELVIGIPTIYRPRGSYLSQTLDSLLNHMTAKHKTRCLIIVFIAEPWNKTNVNITITEIKNKYPSELSSGLIDVITPSPDFYPDLNLLKRTLNDKLERVKWRSKQNLDYAYLMFQAQSRGQYYLQLEDDVITKENYYRNIVNMIESLHETDWFMLKFSVLGFIGRLFRTRDLPVVLEFLLMFHGTKPGDWLIDNLLQTLFCGRDHSPVACQKLCGSKARSIQPSQFQHIGYHSSLVGKVQRLKDDMFRDGRHRNPKHANPKARGFYTTMNELNTFTFRTTYFKNSVGCWVVDPREGDVAVIEYNPPKILTRFSFISGSKQRINATFPESTVVEALIGKDAPQGYKVRDTNSSLKFVTIGKFNQLGVAEGTFHPDFGSIRALRIRMMESVDHIVVLSKIEIYQAAIQSNLEPHRIRLVRPGDQPSAEQLAKQWSLDASRMVNNSLTSGQSRHRLSQMTSVTSRPVVKHDPAVDEIETVKSIIENKNKNNTRLLNRIKRTIRKKK